jgi:hypothetical protein
MPERSAPRRVRTLVLTAISITALVGAVVAVPAFAHDTSSSKKGAKCQEMTGMDMCGNGVYHGKNKGKAKLVPGTMHTIDGALTGTSPCEKSGPPASVGQVAKDSEGHDHRGPLYQYPVSEAQREALIQQQTQARAVAVKYPTVATAEAAGYRKSTPYVPCIGAHYTNTSLVGTFNPGAPSELLYDGTDPGSKIVGLSFLLLHPGGPPDGFAGPNDMWHQHNSNGGLCLNAQGVVVGSEATSKADCEARGGRKAALNDIWMVHDWVVPGWECSWGVFAGECPELGGRVGGTAFDKPDPRAASKAIGHAKKKKKSGAST